MFNLANRITLLRILAVPFIVVILHFPNKFNCLVAMIVFIAASLTDLVDGLVARRHNLVTTFGKFLDPLAYKLLISSVLIMLVRLQEPEGGSWVAAWVVVIIVARELVVTGLRAMASDMGTVIAADRFGKLKTVFQIVALCPLLLHYPWFGFDPRPLGTIVLYMALILTVFSGWNYLYNFYRNWVEEKTTRSEAER